MKHTTPAKHRTARALAAFACLALASAAFAGERGAAAFHQLVADIETHMRAAEPLRVDLREARREAALAARGTALTAADRAAAIEARAAFDEARHADIVQLAALDRAVARAVHDLHVHLAAANYLDLDEADYIAARREVRDAPAGQRDAARAVADDLRQVVLSRRSQVNQHVDAVVAGIRAQIREEQSTAKD
ncbi:MAG: hypothetical protein JJU00_20450 [Opitutales bacterium]|nr:hypothetical protein [Opitutales bacterium]